MFMPSPFDSLKKSSPEFDLSPGKRYTEDDFRARVEFPDEWLVTAEKIKLLDRVVNEHRKVKIISETGREITGFLGDTALANTYTTGDGTITAEVITSVEILE